MILTQGLGNSISGKVLKRHLDRWTPEHHDASYPRLTRSSQINFQTSSFWLEDASYVRLKNISLGYNLPKSLLSKVGIERAKVYVAGENLLTFSGLDADGVYTFFIDTGEGMYRVRYEQGDYCEETLK